VPESSDMRGRITARADLTKVKSVLSLNTFTCP